MANTKANYAAFAEFLSSNPDALAFRRFRVLNLRDLLAYQAELLHLERELQDIEDLDATHQPLPDKRVNRRWTPAMAKETTASQPACPCAAAAASQARHCTLNGSVHPPATILDAYSRKMLEIRRTLKKYNEALERYADHEALPSPSKGAIMAYRKWLDRSDLGASFLTKSVEDTWDSSVGIQDFMTFSPQQTVTTFFATSIVASWRLLRGPSSGETKVYSVNSSDEGRVAQGISVIVSSVFPVLPIVVLYFVHSLIIRIGLILVFTAVFAGLLVFGMNMSPDKVLAITTAIAAVQVVYVGGTSPPSS